jgi:hypothetical protein
MEENDIKASIIIEFKTDRDNIFDNVHKYSSFLNHLLSKHLKSAFFIENIENGVIYFFKNIDNFYATNLPYDESIVEEYERKKIKKHEKFEIMGENLYPNELKENFPKEGVNFYVNLIKGDSKKIIPTSTKHFKSFDKENIEIEKISDISIKIIFKTEKALGTYLRERALLTTGLIEEYLH